MMNLLRVAVILFATLLAGCAPVYQFSPASLALKKTMTKEQAAAAVRDVLTNRERGRALCSHNGFSLEKPEPSAVTVESLEWPAHRPGEYVGYQAGRTYYKREYYTERMLFEHIYRVGVSMRPNDGMQLTYCPGNYLVRFDTSDKYFSYTVPKEKLDALLVAMTVLSPNVRIVAETED